MWANSGWDEDVPEVVGQCIGYSILESLARLRGGSPTRSAESSNVCSGTVLRGISKVLIRSVYVNTVSVSILNRLCWICH
jgi:hypothetical protein